MAHKALLVLVYLFVIFPFASEPLLAIDEYGPTGMSLTAGYAPHDPILITSDDDFETQGWPGSGTPEEPYVIEGLSIEAPSIWAGGAIWIIHTRAHFIIGDCVLYGAASEGHGLSLQNATNGLIERNLFGNNSGGDIRLADGCQNITLRKNKCDFSGTSLWAWNSTGIILINNEFSGDKIIIGNSSNVDIFNNINSAEIDLRVSTYSFTIANNTIIDASGQGSDFYGITLRDCSHGIIRNNTCSVRQGRAIRIWDSSFITIEKNIIDVISYSHQRSYCLNLYGCNDTSTTWNGFINRGTIAGSIYLVSDDNNNFFDYNYYANYAGEDNDNNGIVDNPYNRDGILDNHPLMNSPDFPWVDSPDDLMYDEFNIGYSITWKAIVLYPLNYTIYLDGAASLSGQWNSSFEPITVLVDGLSYGIYDFTIVVVDVHLSCVSDTVYVRVSERISPILDSPNDIVYDELSSNNMIVWNPSDAHPSQYTVYKNGSIHVSGGWNGSAIIVDVDGLSIGVYNFTILVEDVDGNNAIDTVIVLVVDGTCPLLDSPSDVLLIKGGTDYVITWNPYDLHPISYTITCNDIVISSGLCNSSDESISLSLLDFTVGTYNVTLVVTDVGGNAASDSVLVTVLPISTTTSDSVPVTSTTPTTNTTTTFGVLPEMSILMSLSAAGAVVVIVLVFFWFRKPTGPAE